MKLVKLFHCFLSFTLLTAAFSIANAQKTAKTRKKILIVVSSQDKKAEPNVVAGFWFSELTHPLKVYAEAGYDVDIASPNGGLPPFDGFDLKDQINSWFWTNPLYRNKLGKSLKLSDVNPNHYVAIQMVGGHGPMYDFKNNKQLHNITRKIYESGGIVSAICHGPAGLIDLKLSTRENLITGKHITAFSKAEEDDRQYGKYIPFELEPALKENGVIYEKSDSLYGVKVCVDSRIVTGQNPASGHEFGKAVIAEIKKIENK